MAKYNPIPQPTNDPTQLRLSVQAIKEAFEILTGQRGDGSASAASADDLTALQKSTSALQQTVAGLPTGPTVTSVGGQSGVLTLSHGLVISGSDIQADVSLLRGFLSGLTLSTSGPSTTFSVSAGAAVDSTNVDFMKLASAISKTTGAWAVGTGNGSFDGTGSAPSATSGWFHVHLIKRPDTGVVDVATSNSATAPTFGTNIPAAYTLSRRIGSMKTNGSFQWTPFTQVGDWFLWTAFVLDANAITTVTSAASLTLTVPTGVVVTALFNASINNGATACRALFSSLSTNDVAAGDTANNLFAAASGTDGGQFQLLTNTSAQIRHRESATAGSLSVETTGWIDTRGKLS